MLHLQLVAPRRRTFTYQSLFDLYCYDTFHSHPSLAIRASLQCTGVFVPSMRTRHPPACPFLKRCRVSAKFPGHSTPSLSPAADILDHWRLYTVLGVSPNVEAGEIKSAYRQLARQYHPDVCRVAGQSSEEECTRKFIEVQEAYETLTDPRRRFLYDYEMRNSYRAGENGGLGRRRPWQEEKRPWARRCEWSSFEEQEEIIRSWRAQVGFQLDGLKARRRNKPGSWAAALLWEPDTD